MFKSYIQKRLESYVKQYFLNKPDIKLVVVTGSVGKTSTKVAIANLLSGHFRVRLHEGNHNTEISAPVSILGLDYPKNVKNVFEWLALFRAAKKRIHGQDDVDIIVQELGSDRIGQIPHFGTYLSPDIAVITAVSPEHMEYFVTIDNVAKEELSVSNYSQLAIINKDDIDGEYAKYLTNANINTYGTSASAEYYFISSDNNVIDGYKGMFYAPELSEPLPSVLKVLGEHMQRPVIAAVAVGLKLGLKPSDLTEGLKNMQSLPGRMNKLKGFNSTIIIDDTYNSSPLAAKSSLNVLYQLSASQRIVVFGDMNELGDASADEHKALGMLCNPDYLSWVITVGIESEKYLAPAAKEKGCQVKSFRTSLQAGAFVRSVAEEGAAILLKGSQGQIYLEEAVKMLLYSASDKDQLVRQSEQWMKTKNNFFDRFK